MGPVMLQDPFHCLRKSNPHNGMTQNTKNIIAFYFPKIFGIFEL